MFWRASAELRRAHRDAPWLVTGVFVAGRWEPIAPGWEPATARERETSLVLRVDLPVILAPDIRAATRIATTLALQLAAPSTTPARHCDHYTIPEAPEQPTG